MRVSIFAHGSKGQFSISLCDENNKLVAMATGEQVYPMDFEYEGAETPWHSEMFYRSYVKALGLKEHEVHV